MCYYSNTIALNLLSMFVHPFIFHTHLIQFSVAVGLEPTSAVTGREAGYTLARSPVHHRATQRQTTVHAHTHS